MMKLKLTGESCPHCKQTIPLKWTSVSIEVFLAVFAGLGLIFVAALYLMGLTNFTNNLSTSLLTREYVQGNDVLLREIALNYTTYDGGDSFRFAEDLTEHLPRVRYVPTNLIGGMNGVEETLDYGGDCKHSSILFTSMMLSAGYKAQIDCDISNMHCVTKVPGNTYYQNGGQYMIIDLTGDLIKVYNNSVDHWKNNNNVVWRKTFTKDSQDTQVE